MTTDQQIIQAIDTAFGSIERPRRFHPDDGDPESGDHEALLQSRTKESLLLGDVDNAGYDPLCSCSAQGIGYFFPSLARFALPEECDPQEWYADQLLFHLSYGDRDNVFLRYCSKAQRLAVADLLDHIIQSRAAWVAENWKPEQFSECLHLWRAECANDA